MSETNSRNIKVELSSEEANLIIQALGKLPFQEVYKLIEKIHVGANNAHTESKIEKGN